MCINLKSTKTLTLLAGSYNFLFSPIQGALYLLQGYGFGSLACTHDWPLLKECWTSLVQAGHSEKPSIMKLIDHISQKINKLFDTPSVEAKVRIYSSCISIQSSVRPISYQSVLQISPLFASWKKCVEPKWWHNSIDRAGEKQTLLLSVCGRSFMPTSLESKTTKRVK